MEHKLIELTNKDEVCRTYEIYKHCMFMPTEEKFDKKIDLFLNDNSVKIFVCLNQIMIKRLDNRQFSCKEQGCFLAAFVCETSFNKPPAMQGDNRCFSLQSKTSRDRITYGSPTKVKSQEVVQNGHE